MRRHKSISAGSIGALALALLAGAASAEQMSVDDVIAKHIEARGGSDAWAAVSSIRTSGEYESFSKVNTFTRTQVKDRRYRMEYFLGDHPVTKAHDGNVAWWINPMRDPGVKKIKGPDLAVAERERDFPNALFEAADHELTLIGPSEIDGIETLQIDVKRADGSTESWHLDPSTYLEVARVSPGSDFGRATPQRTFYDDFRTVDGVLIPHYIESQWYTRNRVQHVESVELNVDIDAGIFAMPAPPGMEPWVGLGGEWKVAVERTRSPGGPTTNSERTSSFQLLLGNTVLQESYEQDGDQVLVHLAYDRFQEVYRRTSVDSDRGLLDVQQGTKNDDGAYVFDNLETGTTFSAMGTTIHLRTTYSAPSPEGFVATTEASIDGGESWFTAVKATYSR